MKNRLFIGLIFTLLFIQCKDKKEHSISSVKQPLGVSTVSYDSLDLVIKGDLISKSAKAYGYLYEVQNIEVLKGNIDTAYISDLNIGTTKQKVWKDFLPDYYTSQQAEGVILGFVQSERENKWQGFQNTLGYWKIVYATNE